MLSVRYRHPMGSNILYYRLGETAFQAAGPFTRRRWGAGPHCHRPFRHDLCRPARTSQVAQLAISEPFGRSWGTVPIFAAQRMSWRESASTPRKWDCPLSRRSPVALAQRGPPTIVPRGNAARPAPRARASLPRGSRRRRGTACCRIGCRPATGAPRPFDRGAAPRAAGTVGRNRGCPFPAKASHRTGNTPNETSACADGPLPPATPAEAAAAKSSNRRRLKS